MPDPAIAKLKTEAAQLAARAKADRAIADRAERSGMREIAAAKEMKRQADNKFAEVKKLEQARKRDLKLIHIARKQLALTDDAYRALLQRLTGLDTTADMTAHQRRQVLAEFRRFGWKPKRAAKPSAQGEPAGQHEKVRALWLELHRLGAVRDPSSAALGAYCKRMTGVQRPEWLDAKQANRVIESLKQWLERVQGETT